MAGGAPAAEAVEKLRRAALGIMAARGFALEGSIPADMTFRQWCEDLGRRGLKIDRKPFRLDDRPALLPIYDAIPATRAAAAGRSLVIQKATQLGLTVWEVLADIYMAKKWGPVNIGLFLPDQATASFKSEHRFMPIVRSSPELHRELVNRLDAAGQARRVGEGNILTRQFASSLLMFLWTSGRVTTESRPMDIVSLDEVQGMSLGEIDRVFARMGDSDLAFAMLLSTANMPDLDINAWYQRGTQEVWHTQCAECGELSDLSDPAGVFPARSIGYNEGGIAGVAAGQPPMNEYVWTCPRCRAWIPDAQSGLYLPQNPRPASKIRSFLLPRTISPRITPRKMMEDWNAARGGDQRKSFYNRTLARPYIDADQLPVTLAHCWAAVEEGRRAGVAWQRAGNGCLMGIDQMGGWNAVIVKKRLPDGRQAVVHVEAVFDLDPFARCSALMREFKVAMCVVEQLPNVNDARRFALAHKGRVYLAGYADLRDDMMAWGDQASRSDRKTAEEDRTRHTVSLNQYKAMQASLFRVRDRHCLFPDPAELEQEVVEHGVRRRIPILSEWVFDHFTKTALVVEQDPHTRKPRARVMKVGLDPHFSYANMLCDIAWSRINGMTTIILPDDGAGARAAQSAAVEAMGRAMPGLPPYVLAAMDPAPEGTCGRWASFAADPAGAGGRCSARGLLVAPRDFGCDI